MCGKFTQMMTWKEVHDLSEVYLKEAERQKRKAGGGGGDDDEGGGGGSDEEEETKTPMGWAHVIHLNADGERTTTLMRWGWPDRKQPDPSRGFKHLHARSETIDTLPTFAEAFRERRGMIIVPTFNEGEELPNGKTKQWIVRHATDPAVAIAVIYESWINPTTGELFECFVMATTEPAPALTEKNITRMPALLPQEDAELWLGQIRAPLEEIKAVLRPYEGPLVVSEPPKKAPPPKKPKASKPQEPPPQDSLF